MVKIRLKRIGATKRPFYRLVVADSRSPRDGRFIEEIGVYDPLVNPARVVVDVDKVRDWMRKGAQPSDTARKLLEQQGVLVRAARPQSARAATAGDGGAARAAATAEVPERAPEPPRAGDESDTGLATQTPEGG